MDFREFFKDPPVFLAPMAGVTDAPFRNEVLKFGASAVVSEMVSSEALVRNREKTFNRLKSFKKNPLNIIQILGDNPEKMAEAAKINQDLGAEVIDINMGCPVKKIVANNSGAALLKNLDLASKIVNKVVESINIPVTVKIRLGWDEASINFLELAKHLEDAGAKMLEIHARTRSQMYGGKANLELLSNLKKVIKIPYICNGDITTVEEAEKALFSSKAFGVMIGRAALGRPWFLDQVMYFLKTKKKKESPNLETQCNTVMEQFENTLDFYGVEAGIRMFRKHFCWYSNGLKNSSSFRERINSTTDLEYIKNLVKELYEKQI